MNSVVFIDQILFEPISEKVTSLVKLGIVTRFFCKNNFIRTTRLKFAQKLR